MKKRICLLLTVLLLLSGCGKEDTAPSVRVGEGDGSLNDPVNQQVTQQTGFTGTGDLLLPDAAETVALDHAGLDRAEVTGLHTALEVEDGTPCYEVEFRVGHLAYSYEIHAQTGAILSFDTDD